MNGHLNGNQRCMKVNSVSPDYLGGTGYGYMTSGIRMYQLQERYNMNGRNGVNQNERKC